MTNQTANDMPPPPSRATMIPATTNPATLRNRLTFACALATLAATWLIALPRLATTKPIADRIAANERLGIDPSAMFYTELDIAPGIAHKAERRRAAGDLPSGITPPVR